MSQQGVPETAVLPSGRLRVPRHLGERYIAEYRRGWRTSRNPKDGNDWETGAGSEAFDDGYLDYATEREKWHLAWCINHDGSLPGCSEMRK